MTAYTYAVLHVNNVKETNGSMQCVLQLVYNASVSNHSNRNCTSFVHITDNEIDIARQIGSIEV